MAVEAPELHRAQLPAEAAGPSEISPDLPAGMAPIAAIGGLLSVKAQWRFYSPLLASRPGSPLSTQERFSAIPERGLGDFDDMYSRLEERFVGIHERLGERTVVVAQSLGGLFATELALDHPDKVAAVVCLAGVQAGVRGETPAATLLRRSLGNPSTAENLQADSNFMLEHKEKIASEWSPDTSLHLIAPTTDVLVPIAQGLDLEMPEGQEPEKRVVTPHGIPAFVMRKVFGMPEDAKPLRSVVPADHISIAVTPSVIQYTRAVRKSAAETAEDVTAPAFALEPLAAAA